MHVLISNPITIFPTYEAAKKVADANSENVTEGETTEYRVTEIDDGRFTIAIYEDCEFMMCL